MPRFIYLLAFLINSELATGQDKTYEFTTSDGVHLYLRTAGKGNPCLFVHGGPGNTSHYFEPLPAAKLLESKMQMVYYDQRGSGRSSSAKDSNYSIARMEKDIEEIRIFLKIKTWVVMGHSFGGYIITAYARDYPENVRSLIYVHCTMDFTSAFNSHIKNGTELLREIGISYRNDTTVSKLDQIMNVHKELEKQGIEYKIMFRSQAEKNIDDSLISTATPHFNQDFSKYVWSKKDSNYWMDYSVFTRDINCPVLVIAGKKDFAVGPDSYKSWKFKNMKLLLYEGAHVSFQEEPLWFIDGVFQFLQK